jgi:hypothetical protein
MEVLMQSETTITCPNCGTEFELSEVIINQVKGEYEEKFKLDIQEEKKKIKESVEKDLNDSYSQSLEDLKSQISEKDGKLTEFTENEKSLRKRLRNLEDKEKNLDLEIDRQIDAAREKFFDEQKSKELEKEKIINDLKDQINDLKKKAEQGSMQLQGEVMELDLQSQLQIRFPYDEIVEVPKGVEGADIIQTVKNFSTCCGTIIWEVKNTKNWSDKWVDKLKEDQRAKKAEIAIIVSSALPANIKNCGNINGIWICNYAISVEIAEILRNNLVSMSQALVSHEGKDEKMEAVYNYLSSPAFKFKVEAILEAFTTMKSDLDKEKNAIQKLWDKRETQLLRVLKNTAGMYGDLEGIIGNTLPKIEALELESTDES